jgi:hypothetical protein
MDQLRAAVKPLVPGGAPGRASVAVAAIVAVAVVLGATSEIGSGRPSPPLARTFDSAEAAASAVLEGLAARDVAALRELSLTEDEFRDIVWPELPSSRPEVNLPVAYAWGTLAQNSQGSLATTIAAHGGRRYTLVNVRVTGRSTPYESFTVHRDVALDVVDEAGVRRQIQVIGSLLERDGRCKVFSFVAD